MVTIAILFVFITAAFLAMAAKRWNLHRSFAWISGFPTVLFLGSLAGLLTDSNSWVFFVGFVLSLFAQLATIAGFLWLVWQDTWCNQPCKVINGKG